MLAERRIVLGITGPAAWQSERILVMAPGESTEIAGYHITFKKVEQVPSANYTAERATIDVARAGKPITTLYPEKRRFTNPPQVTTEAAIHTTWLADLYAVIGDPDGEGGWSVRIYHNPLVPWIWLGAILIVVGGAVSLTDRRLRVGAPRRARAAAGADAKPQTA